LGRWNSGNSISNIIKVEVANAILDVIVASPSDCRLICRTSDADVTERGIAVLVETRARCGYRSCGAGELYCLCAVPRESH